MNIYRLIALLITLVFAAHIFHATEAVSTFIGNLNVLVKHISDIPQFDSYANTPIFKLAVRCVYLIAIVGVIKLIIGRKDESE